MFAPNLTVGGRIVRGLLAVICFIAAWYAIDVSIWLGLLLTAYAIFTLFEAIRGWCIVRACGIKTKI